MTHWNPDIDSYGIRVNVPSHSRYNKMDRETELGDRNSPGLNDIDPEAPNAEDPYDIAQTNKPPEIKQVPADDPPTVVHVPDDISGVDREEDGNDGDYGKMNDAQFLVQVYFYGLTIFIIYYSMDMTVLAPSISMLTGFIVLSFQEVYYLFATTIIREDLLLAKTMTCLSLALTLIAIAELLASTVDIIDDDAWPQETTASIMFTYVLPYFACFTIGILPRSCSKSIVIRRAMPSAVAVALFIVVLVQSITMVVRRYEQSLVTVLTTGYTADSNDLTPALDDVDINDLSLYDIATPNLGPPSMAMILLLPLFKLAMTLGVITSSVNRKTTEIAAFMTFLTGFKELHVQSAPEAHDHVLRATIIAACATAFSAVRYCRPVVAYMLR